MKWEKFVGRKKLATLAFLFQLSVEVAEMAMSGLNDRIRLLVREQYVEQAMRLGSKRLSIRVKDILKDVASDPSARGRTPAICEVLQGSKLLRENGLEIEGVEGPLSKQSTTVVVHDRILPQALAAGRKTAAGFRLLPFADGCVEVFGQLRSKEG